MSSLNAEAVSTAPADAHAAGRSAMRKATWRLIPLIAFGYGVAYMDRVNISFASLRMNSDLHFSATIYGLGAGLFFLSYAACEIPSNLLLYRIGARRWLSRIMVTWGVLAMCMMLVRTPLQFYAARLLLGAAEAGFFPGVLFYLSQWFPADRRARAISRFYISLPLSSTVMGAVAGALLNLHGKLGLAGWQWLFLAEGFPAVILSAVFFRCLPDGPRDAAWLTAEEVTWIEGRLAQEYSESSHAHASSLRTAFTDVRIWLFSLVNLLMLLSNYAYGFSAPAILQKLTSLSVTRVGFLVSAMGLLGGCAMLFNSWLSDRNGERHFHIVVPSLLESVAYLIAGISANPFLAVSALVVMFLCQNAMQGPLLVLPTTFFKGRNAAAGIAIFNTVGILGGFLGPYGMGLARDMTGSYQAGLALLSLPMLMMAAIVIVVRAISQKRRPQFV